MIVIVDYGMGNIASIQNMIHRIGAESVISDNPDVIREASAVILPGVGAFDNAMQKLQSKNLVSVIKEKILINKTPFLGVCLGMQILFDSSEEGVLPGLGIFPGSIRKFSFPEDSHLKLKVPHMGWNTIQPNKKSLLFMGYETEARFYFVHSYHVVCDNPSHIAAECHYGSAFTCAVEKDGHVFAVQFHPEKSHKYGIQLFKNFLERTC